MNATAAPFTIETLLEIMARLRAPEGGCPWDLEQDFSSIAPYTLEEAYEVVEAIEQGDRNALCEELGDLLFQVVFHAQMAKEAGWFEFNDVLESICDKMVRRHPHVFADAYVEDAAAQTRAWELHKDRERGGHRQVLDGVPKALPALTRAEKLQKKAARVGLDWPDSSGAADKVAEELNELRAELATGAGSAALKEEAGDLLFAAVNLVRHAGVDPEAALRQANGKFIRRVQQLESCCQQAGQTVASTDPGMLDIYWDRVKGHETSGN